MIKRVLFVILCTLTFPVLFLLLYPKEEWVFDASYYGYQSDYYAVFHDQSNIMICQYNDNGTLTGKWKTPKYDNYDIIEVEDMAFHDGYAYCVLKQYDCRNYKLTQRSWFCIDFQQKTSKEVCNLKYKDIENPFSTSLTYTESGLYSVSAYKNYLVRVNVLTKKEDIIYVNAEGIVNYSAMLPSGRLFFTDILSNMYIIGKDGNVNKVYSADLGSYSAVTVRDDGCCYIYDWKKQTWFKSNSIDETTQIQFHSSGLEESSIEDYSIPKSISILKLVLCSIVGLGVGLLIIGIVSARRISLLVKVFGIMSVTFVVGGTLLFYMVNQIIVQFYMQSEIDKCIMSSHTISAKINVAKLETIDWNVQRQNEYFSELCEIMQYRDESEYVHAELKDKDQRIVIQENTFHCLYLIQNNEIVLAVNDQLPANIPAEVMVDSALITALNKVKDKECTSFMYGVDDKKSEWIICITPIVNEQGKVVALQETGISKHQYTTDTNKNLRTIMWTVTAIEGAVGILLLLCMRILLVSLKKLHRAVEAVGQENFSICVPIKGRDEIAEISEAFNTMSGKIGNHTAHLHTLNQSYLRFLPSETLNAIGKKSVLSVNRNDYSKIERYILHINFIDFHSVTDAMKDDDAFAFVNNLSNTIMEQVFQHNGFVESYNQEAFICLFTQAEDAYHAGVEIVRQLHDIEQCPQVTLVLVKGDALLGVIGHEKRLGTLMISDALRLSKKLGQLAGYCGINFLRTDNINFSRIYPERELGIFNFEGKSYVIKECFEGDSITEFMNKKEYLTQFNTIIHNFYQEDFQECKRSSIEYLRLVKHETLIAKYLFLCEHNLIHPDEPLGLESIND